jgi:fluoride exporter
MINNILLVGLGGGIGSIARYLCQRWVAATLAHPFPWGTLAVNVTGCFLIGIFFSFHLKTAEATESWKLFLMTGLCGGFTTFSAFTLEGLGLLKEQKLVLFFTYVAGSVILGLLATFLGMRMMK